MKLSLWLLMIVVSVSGCGGAELNLPCNGFGCEFDLSSPDNVRLRNYNSMNALTQSQFDEMIVTAYHETETCTKIMAGGPLIIASDWPYQQTPPVSGVTFLDDGLIVVALHDVLVIPNFPGVLRHEFVHYLLWVSGFPNDLNMSHQSPLFHDCSGNP